VSGYCNINNVDLRVAGATVCGHPRCPNIVILHNTNLRVAGATVCDRQVTGVSTRSYTRYSNS
jgi:hypothetical protein